MFPFLLAINWSSPAAYTGWELLVIGVVASVVGGLTWSYTVFWLKQRRCRNAGEPWRCRNDWAKGEIRGDKTFGFNFFSWVIIGWLNLIAWRAFYLYNFGKLFWPCLLLSNVACFMLKKWLLKRRQKFGRCLLKLSTVPGRIGVALEGTIWLEKKADPGDVYSVGLLCFRDLPTPSDSASRIEVIWQTEHEVAAQPSRDVDFGSVIPISFKIPGDCPESGDLTEANRIQWQVRLDAKSFQSDCVVNFQVPVYKLKKSDRKPNHSKVRESQNPRS